MVSGKKRTRARSAWLLLCGFVLVGTATFASAAQAADKSQQAYWAGFAYTADQSAVEASTPRAPAAGPTGPG